MGLSGCAYEKGCSLPASIHNGIYLDIESGHLRRLDYIQPHQVVLERSDAYPRVLTLRNKIQYQSLVVGSHSINRGYAG